MNLLEVERLNVRYRRRPGFFRATGTEVQAAVDVSFRIRQGTTLGLVGESGSGKSTVARAILGLEPIVSGAIVFAGNKISGLSEAAFRPYRKRIQMVFQDPFGSLDPRWTVGAIVAEPLQVHFPRLDRTERTDRVVALLEKVGLEPAHRQRWPHQLSGGQRQRVGIARALAVEPELIVCDEPVSALDVSIQAQVVNLLQDLQQELGLTYLFIAHDLAVVEHLSQEVVVMHRGRVVEAGPVTDVYGSPQSEYTRTLLAAVPSV